MKMKAVLLAGGSGTRLWPYAEIRNKAMAPVANRPLAAWAVDAALAAGMDGVVIAAGPHGEQITHHFAGNDRVRVSQAGPTKGAAFTLAAVKGLLDGSFIVLNGDTLYEPEDIAALAGSLAHGPCVLLAKVPQGEHCDHICAEAEGGLLRRVEGHPLNAMGNRIAAYGFTPECWPAIENCSTLIDDIYVGMMPPLEGFMEMAVADCLRAGIAIQAVDAEGECIDVDKPWQLMKANAAMVEKLCPAIKENHVGEGSTIDPTAIIEGHVVLGKRCTVGRNVLIKGNVIVGDNTEIVDGAMLLGDCVIGSDCSIRQYCLIEGGSVLGNRCVVGHGAEFSGVAFDTVYLYHYMEFWGILGRNVDLGAATVCGTLRFDNGQAEHRVKGRRERPADFANATYVGDFCRTGVNAIFMPGVKTGVYCIVGPGVLLSEDLPNNKIVMLKQETTMRDWSPDKYGW
jgi:NDP-sugar pyrophosphorylase family protein